MLIDQILELDEKRAVTVSIVKDSWPLWNGSGVPNLVLIELAAQTAGVCNGWIRMQTEGRDTDTRGWLVGVKKADFRTELIPRQERIVTCAENTFQYDKLREVFSTLRSGSEIYGEVVLQLIQA